MKETKPASKATTTVKKPQAGIGDLFDKANYTWMAIGLVVMAIGLILMAGGRSEDPNVFNTNEVYGTRRITIAPIIILAGLIIEIVAIFKSPKKS